MTFRRILIGLIVVGVVVGAGALAYALRYPALPAVTPPDPASFDSATIEKGRSLAHLGDCGVCHTRAGGEPYAGGLALPSPFGTIYTTNITPDPETGIGTWSLEAFMRAMHEGVDRNGGYLYPAFPYDHFTKVTEEDIGAIYAYLMADVAPVAYEQPPNDMPFPFNIRLGVAFWNLLFLRQGVFEPDPDQSAEWNRGAYLVEGLSHCGACHSPRNVLGAVDMGAGAFNGGEAEGWHAPALDEDSTALVRWTQVDLVDYLYDGWHEDHSIASGPMTPIIDDLYDQTEDDVFAIAAYITSLDSRPIDEAANGAARAHAASLEWGAPDAPPVPTDPVLAEGARVFEARCSTCHKSGGLPAPVALTASVNAPHPGNLVRVIQDGIKPARNSLDRGMPAQALNLTDEEFIAVVQFTRDRFSDLPAWTNVPDEVHAVRQGD